MVPTATRLWWGRDLHGQREDAMASCQAMILYAEFFFSVFPKRYFATRIKGGKEEVAIKVTITLSLVENLPQSLGIPFAHTIEAKKTSQEIPMQTNIFEYVSF